MTEAWSADSRPQWRVRLAYDVERQVTGTEGRRAATRLEEELRGTDRAQQPRATIDGGRCLVSMYVKGVDELYAFARAQILVESAWRRVRGRPLGAPDAGDAAPAPPGN